MTICCLILICGIDEGSPTLEIDPRTFFQVP
jgi:hypothetical protein